LVNLTDKRSTSEALKIAKEWVKLMPDDTEAHAAVGRCLFKTKAYKDSLKEYQTAQDANPSYDYPIANCYFQLGNLPEASKWAQAALSKAEKNSIPKSPSITDSLPSFAPTPLQDTPKKQDPRELPNVLYLLSDIHKKQGDYTTAYDYITRYTTLLPKEPRGYMSQVSLLKKLNRQHESYGVLSNVLSLWTDSCSSGTSPKERTARCREYFAIHKVELKALKEIGEHCKITVPADEVDKLQMCKKYETLKSVYVGS
jgi:tetratricopeptide (TPR) repeat protein